MATQIHVTLSGARYHPLARQQLQLQSRQQLRMVCLGRMTLQKLNNWQPAVRAAIGFTAARINPAT